MTVDLLQLRHVKGTVLLPWDYGMPQNAPFKRKNREMVTSNSFILR